MRGRLAQRPPLAHEAEQLRVGRERQPPLGRVDPPAARQRPLHERERAALGRRVEGVAHRRRDAGVAQQLAEALRLLRHDDQAIAAAAAAREILGGGLQPAGVGVVRGERQPQRVALAAGRPAREVGTRELEIELADQRLLGQVGQGRVAAELALLGEQRAALGGERVLLGRRRRARHPSRRR